MDKMQDVELRARELAHERRTKGWTWWAHSITSNPYYRGTDYHVVWHNAFYDECRLIGRSIR